jgi:pimeloyl-ACP methyl ester carboxylesterase
MRVIGALLAVVALGAVAWLAFLFAVQRAAIFPAPPPPRFDVFAATPGIERIVVPNGGGESEAWLLPAARRGAEPSPALIFAHGNGELIDHWVGEFDEPRRRGLAVLLVEYPGYGRSSGAPSRDSIARAMIAAYDALAARAEVDASRIVGYGRSLGGGAVCDLARVRRLAALVLESSFTSARSLAWRFGLPPFLVRDPFDNEAALREFAGPLLVVHGERDEMIPVAHAHRLAASVANARLELLACGHNDCPRPWPALLRFLAEAGLLAGGA